MAIRYSDFRELPFAEIWAVDTEYYPGPGLAHGGREGDPITPLCLTGIELRSGRVVQRWQDELDPFPPYRLDIESLFVSYLLTAEFGFHRALGWGPPASALDPYVEFRRLTNDARVKAGDRPKGFYSLAGALRWFGEEELDVAHKDDMRGRILEGPPFSTEERLLILRYNLDDANGLVRLFRRIVPTIVSLPHALYRGEFEWALSAEERRGCPIDLAGHERIRSYWDDIRSDCVTSVDYQYGCYEIIDGVPHFRDERFHAYLQRQRIPWPRLISGELNKRNITFGDMAKTYPQLANLHELRGTLSQLRSNQLAIGRDGRNRCLLGPFGTKTGRNAPSNSKYIFGPAKCLRFLITPEPEMALDHRDYRQQEVRIAAVLSGDPALLAACEENDVYLGIAQQLGFTPENCPGLRSLFKVVVLGVQYGLEARSLALRAGISLYEAREILARLRARFRVFEEFCANLTDYAGLRLTMSTHFGWTVDCPPDTSPRTIRNWPIQSAGAAIMHAVVILAERRGIPIVAPIHDAFIAEGAAADIADVSEELDRVMRDASAIVLKGYEIPTDDGRGPIMPGERFYDERGEGMWRTINRLIGNRERKTA